MTQREIKRAIYLSGVKSTGYTVHHDVPGESIVCEVPSVDVGNTIVRALRERQAPRQQQDFWNGSCWVRG